MSEHYKTKKVVRDGKQLGINIYNSSSDPLYVIAKDSIVYVYKKEGNRLTIEQPIGSLKYDHEENALIINNIFDIECGRITIPDTEHPRLEDLLNGNYPIETKKGKVVKDVFEFLKAESSS